MAGNVNIFRRIRTAIRSFFYAPVGTDLSELVNPNGINFGVTVNKDAALRFTAVFAAIKILSENIASLPRNVLRKTENGYEEDRRHPAFRLLSLQPNEYCDNFTFWFAVISSILSKGNAYVIIKYSGSRPDSLHLVPAGFVEVGLVDGHKMYKVSGLNDELQFLNGTYEDYEVIHLMYYSLNGLKGIDPISYNAAAIGRGIATQKFSAEFYEKGGQIKGTLETENALGDDQYDQFMKHYAQAAQNYETPLLEYGIKYKSIGISPVAAQLIQSETLSIQDIARIYSIPPHLLAEMSHATFSNIEQQNIYFATYSLRPLCKRIEQQLERKLFLESERAEGYSIKFDLRGMMRGDDSARAAYYEKGINSGWMSPNEARNLEGLSRKNGLDATRLPLNTGIISEDGTIINPNNDKQSNNE